MADLWLSGMAAGAAASKRTVQYCMPYPNQVLAAAAYPAVTNARATGDYFHADNQGSNSVKASSLLSYLPLTKSLQKVLILKMEGTRLLNR